MNISAGLQQAAALRAAGHFLDMPDNAYRVTGLIIANKLGWASEKPALLTSQINFLTLS